MSEIVDWLKPKVLLVGAIIGLILAAGLTLLIVQWGGSLYAQWFGLDYWWSIIAFVCTLLVIGLVIGFGYGWFIVSKNPLVSNKINKEQKSIYDQEESK